ncbi:unnamed protein product [Caretta caretta]
MMAIGRCPRGNEQNRESSVAIGTI